VTITLRLRQDFELVHEPITEVDAQVFKEEERVSLKLRDRLRNSSGGTFLITGFRGVGKTTAVHQALRQLETALDEQVISITVPVARFSSTSALLFVVIRRLVEQLLDNGIVGKLSPPVAERLLTAYQRTSYAYKETSTSSEEKGVSYGIEGSISAGQPRISLPLPRFSRTRSRAESQARELSFLAYSEDDVEYDFLRIIDLLGREDAVRRGRAGRLLSVLGFDTATTPLDARIVIVFDEIDKLTEADKGLETFEQMLGGLKNLLASSGVHFVVVGGVDLHDEWLRESATADSLYRSVFAWQGYVGCNWKAARLLLEESLAAGEPEDIDVLAGYLAYRGRGIIRNVLYEFNELVEWDDQGPLIEIAGVAEERVRLLSELTAALEKVFAEAEESVLAAPSDHDRLRQASYFTVDWVLRAGHDAFTVADVLDPRRGHALDSVLRPREKIVRPVLTALVRAGYLEAVVPGTEQVTQGPGAEPHPEQYELSSQLLDRLERIAVSSPRGRAELGRGGEGPGAADENAGTPREAAQEALGRRYKIVEMIGRGGFGTVWSGIGRRLKKRVALKVIRTPDAEAKQRVRREAKLLRMAQTPGVVNMIELIEAEDRMVLVTELVEGTSLADFRDPTPSFVVEVGIQIARTLEELHAKGIVHADIKPANLIMTLEGRVVLIDLGTAQLKGEVSLNLVGTPAYMAPELVRGRPAEERSDVWSLALIMVEMLGGEIPRRSDPEVFESSLSNSLGDCSVRLREVLQTALAPAPEDRPSAAEFRQLLRATAEAHPTLIVG
jgi:serine/threonine-protein kinase